MPSRRTIVVALAVLELWILGSMFAVAVGPRRSGPAWPWGMPAEAAGATRTVRTVIAGPSPRIYIDDADAALTLTAIPGAAVHVDEQLGSRSDGRLAEVTQSADGVRIVRHEPALRMNVAFGRQRRTLAVTVPPDARVEVAGAGSIDASGLRDRAVLHTENGRIAVRDHRGELTVTTENGAIDLRDVNGPSVEATGDNGWIRLDGVRTPHAALKTDNGRITVARSAIEGGSIATDNGTIELSFIPGTNVTVRASTSLGRVIAETPLRVESDGSDDDGQRTVRVGAGTGLLEVSTDNGTITISGSESSRTS